MFEVLVVDNDNPVRPGPLPHDTAADLPVSWHLLHCPTPGSYAARNRGAAAARGDWLVFTDADCVPGPDWLDHLAAAALAQPGHLLAGPVRMIAPGPDPAVPLNACQTYELLRGIPQERYVRNGYAATANLCVPRAVFAALGGFDPARLSGGDAAFCRKAVAAGHPLVLVPGAVVEHPCRSDWAALAIKARRVKGGQLRGGSRRTRALWLLRSLTPPLRQIARLARHPAPLAQRLTASRIALRLWGVELVEMARLLAGGLPERR